MSRSICYLWHEKEIQDLMILEYISESLEIKIEDRSYHAHNDAWPVF